MSDRRATCMRCTVQTITPAMAIAKHTTATVIPALQYQDAPTAIDFCARPSEGNVWTFGSYDPWAEH